ncbi:50S ribosomal protein L11 methyltransferase [Desulfallas thermosapovorans]|uniref:Ribosomal protein L11 methyltransferase n=1 Tax=Desulfallas thermosapovorans DSM 6562 TaxID=1121431 RepID=A0A5S4ZWQ9_9FIRM|nr:50S ribosomal protein L11 methyltransferase [Desulfallas thermosapovorans]TYO97249.1 ribosomal protein L11 methyltransferase [Desulfallas thermosapovorans DSM 6562]
MTWLEIAVTAPAELVEVVANVFNEIGSGGVVIEDPALIVELVTKGNAETVSPALELPQGGQTTVKGYFCCDCSLPERLESLSRRLTNLPVRWRTREVREQDWATAWQKYYKPLRVGKNIVVKPYWEDYCARVGEIIIELDPGMAFGCGTHATTAMCLVLLEEFAPGCAVVYDVGTGSGILAVAAALLGARQVSAVDIDETAVRAARENARRNGVADRVSVARGNLLDDLAAGQADLVVANIIADVIISLAPAAAAALKPGGRLIASGIINERAREVRRALVAAGLEPVKELTEGEWVAVVYRSGGNTTSGAGH